MQFFIYFSIKEGEAMTPPSPENMAEMSQFMEESFKSGIVVSTGHLPDKIIHVSLKSGEISVTDGPFMEGKELIPGFTIIEVDTKEKAIEWTTKLRKCMGEGTLKMAPIFIPSMD